MEGKRICELYSSGMTLDQVAKKEHVSVDTVLRTLKRHGVPTRKPGRQKKEKGPPMIGEFTVAEFCDFAGEWETACYVVRKAAGQ